MAGFKKKFTWEDNTSADLQFDIEFNGTKAEAVNIRITTSGEGIDLPKSPIIVENKDGERVFRGDHINKQEGHSFEYIDNRYSKEIIAEIDRILLEQTT